MVIQNQLLPKSGNVIVRTRATLAKLMQVQKVSNAAWPRLGTIMPSNLHTIEMETLTRNHGSEASSMVIDAAIGKYKYYLNNKHT